MVMESHPQNSYNHCISKYIYIVVRVTVVWSQTFCKTSLFARCACLEPCMHSTRELSSCRFHTHFTAKIIFTTISIFTIPFFTTNSVFTIPVSRPNPFSQPHFHGQIVFLKPNAFSKAKWPFGLGPRFLRSNASPGTPSPRIAPHSTA